MCSDLAESPAWKPHELQIVVQLVDELKKDIENSDDEDEPPSKKIQTSPNNQPATESHTHSTYFPGIPAHAIPHEDVLKANLASGQRPLTRCPKYTEFSASSSVPARKPISYNPPLSDDALYLKANYPDVPPTPMPRDSAGHVNYLTPEGQKIIDSVMATTQNRTNHSPTISPAPPQPSQVSETVISAHNKAWKQRKIDLATRDYKYGHYHNSMPENWQSNTSSSHDHNTEVGSDNEEQDIPVPPISTCPVSVPAPPRPLDRMVSSVDHLFTPHPMRSTVSNISWNYKIPSNPSTNTQTTNSPPAKQQMTSQKSQDDIPVVSCEP